MGIYVYCVVPSGVEPPPQLRGLDGEAIRRARLAGLDLWVGAAAARPTPSVQSMRAHNAVVTEALGLGWTPLPFRFGQWLDGEVALERALDDRADELAAALGRVQGAVEYGVRVLDPTPSEDRSAASQSGAETTGRAYLLQLSRRLGGGVERSPLAVSVASALRDAAGDDLVEWRESLPETTHGVLAVAHLVGRSHGDAYLERVRSVRDRFPSLRFLFSGPWPPYSFGPERGPA